MYDCSLECETVPLSAKRLFTEQILCMAKFGPLLEVFPWCWLDKSSIISSLKWFFVSEGRYLFIQNYFK